MLRGGIDVRHYIPTFSGCQITPQKEPDSFTRCDDRAFTVGAGAAN